MIVRSTVSPYYHYTDTDNRERRKSSSETDKTKQNKKKKKGDEVYCGRKNHKKIQSCDEKMTNVSGQEG